jgi:Protein of unknown function (DUF3467)
MVEKQQPEDTSGVPEEPLTKEVRSFTFRRGADFHVIYANSVRFATAPWDFSLVFGQTIVDKIDDVYIEDKVTVTLSPQTAKAMADILNRNLADYERQFGEIRYTPIQASQSGQSENPQEPSPQSYELLTKRKITLEEDDKKA